MRRNWDTIRTMLFAVEAGEPIKNDDQTVGHVRMAIDARFLHVDVQTAAITRSSAELVETFSLTWAGYELLDAIRDDRVWDCCRKAIAFNGGGLPTDVLLAVAKRAIELLPRAA